MSERVSVKEAAEMLEVSENIIRMMCKTGQLGKVVQDGQRSIFLIYRKQVAKIKDAPAATGADLKRRSISERSSKEKLHKERIPQKADSRKW